MIPAMRFDKRGARGPPGCATTTGRLPHANARFVKPLRFFVQGSPVSAVMHD
jgi:hypothetical protein